MRDLTPWRRFIEDALNVGWQGHTYEDICREIEDGTMQIWTRPDAAVVTQIVLFPQYKQCFICFAGGNLAAVESIAVDVEAYARAEGCDRMAFIGRPGWQRTFLNRTGWHTDPVVYMEKEL
jgi:hypothetical protein